MKIRAITELTAPNECLYRKIACRTAILRKRMKSLFVALCVGVFAACGWAQTSKILVPASTARHSTDPKGLMHTDYLVFQGKWDHPTEHQVFPMAMLGGGAFQSAIQGYHPADVKTAYGMLSTGGSQAIAIIDAYDLPTSLHDFNTFSTAFGLPTETSTNSTASTNQVFQVIYSAGSKPSPSQDWGGEISLDIEWAHAIAPKAKIYLIECPSAALTDLVAGVQYAVQHLPNVREISMSFGGGEDPSETQMDADFVGTNKVFFAATGDVAGPPTYPATSPNVVAVGGTSLDLSASDQVLSETAWNGESNGPSTVESRPAFQNSVASIVGNLRGTPDMSADADPNTGCAVYNSYGVPGATPDPGEPGWYVFGGTSLACPICAGFTNLRGLFASNTQQELTRQYSQLAATKFYRDITSGSSSGYSAAPGYDLVTGIGAPCNMYASHNYLPTPLIVTNGTVVEGTTGSVAAIDGHDWVVRSVQTAPSTQSAVVTGTFTVTPSSGTTLAVNLSITALDGPATCTVSFLVPGTSNWISVGQPSFGATNTTQTLSFANISQYLDSTGHLQFKIGAVAGGSTAFRLGLDQIMLTTYATQ